MCWIAHPNQILDLQILSPILQVAFPFFRVFLEGLYMYIYLEVLYFDEVQFICFFFCCYPFDVIPKKPLSKSRS